MSDGILTVDGSTASHKVQGDGGIHISVSGVAFGGGSVAVEQKVNDTWAPLLDLGVAITITVADDSLYNVKKGDHIRLTLSGSTSPTIPFTIRG